MRIEVVRVAEAPEKIAEWLATPAFPEVDAHPVCGRFGRGYYPAVYGDALVDETFVICDRDYPLAIVPCSAIAGVLGNAGQPIKVFSAIGINPAMAELIADQIVAELSQISQRHLIREICIAAPVQSILDAMSSACLKSGYVADVCFHATCDLGLSEAQLFGFLRRSLRSRVKWGKNNIRLEYIGAEMPNRAAFDSYQKFHARIAGRTTRSQASWDKMYEWIASGGGELSLGYLGVGGELVSGLIVVDGSECSYYASAVYDREKFDKPLAHWPLYDAILRARSRGMRRFDVGEIPQVGFASEKEVNIGQFKRQFATEIVTSLRWRRSQPTGE